MRALTKGFQKLFELTEWFYIREAKLGDRDAFGKLYQHYGDRIYRFVYFRCGQHRENAEDIAADVFVKAWEKLHTFKKGNFQAWLYMIAKNTLVDFYRSTKMQVPLSEDVVDNKPSIVDMVSMSLETQRVKEAMKELTPEQQEVLALRFIEDLSYKEIAEIVAKQEDAVRALSSRGIKELRKIINV